MLLYQTPPPEYEEDATTWIALADLMTGLMAIFLALSIAILIQMQNTQIQIAEDVTNALKQHNIEIKADEKTGDIVLTEQVSFDVGQAVLTEQGKETLNRFIPIYAKAIFGTLTLEQQKRIKRLLVEGHTDTTGNDLFNMDLSNRRAYAIIAHIHAMPNFEYKDKLLQNMTVVGRGQNDATGEHDKDRKVMFRFDFHNKVFDNTDENMANGVKQNINNHMQLSQPKQGVQ